MTCHVFTYGSLMFADVWTRVVVGRYDAVRATLVDHARFAIHDEDYPGVVARTGARVDGLLYLDVAAEDLERLDAFEGDDYLRGSVAVACTDGGTRRAETYVYRRDDRLLASPWEPDAFAMERFLATYCRDRLDR